MSQEIYIALAGYVTSEVSRTITVRVIESRDHGKQECWSSAEEENPKTWKPTTKCSYYTTNQVTSKDTYPELTCLNTESQPEHIIKIVNQQNGVAVAANNGNKK